MEIDKIITESINKVLSEAFQSTTLRNLHRSTPSDYRSLRHGANDFSDKTNSDAEAHGLPTNNGLYTDKYLDKITDDMIETMGTIDSFARQGFTFDSHPTYFGIGSQEVYDPQGNRRYAMMLRNGQMVIFKNDPQTLEKIRTLGNQAGELTKKRDRDRRNDGKNDYVWTDSDKKRRFNYLRGKALTAYDKKMNKGD